MKPMQKWMCSLALVAVLHPMALPLHAEEAPPTSDHRVGVIMMVICGVSVRLAPAAPIPLLGVAVASCLAGCLDALLDPD